MGRRVALLIIVQSRRRYSLHPNLFNCLFAYMHQLFILSLIRLQTQEQPNTQSEIELGSSIIIGFQQDHSMSPLGMAQKKKFLKLVRINSRCGVGVHYFYMTCCIHLEFDVIYIQFQLYQDLVFLFILARLCQIFFLVENCLDMDIWQMYFLDYTWI